MKRAREAHVLDIDVGLIETVEEHQGVGAGRVQPLGEVRERSVERRELTAKGMRTTCLMAWTISAERASIS